MSGATTALKASEGSDCGGGMSLSGYGFELDFLPVGTGTKSGDAISIRIGIPGTIIQFIEAKMDRLADGSFAPAEAMTGQQPSGMPKRA